MMHSSLACWFWFDHVPRTVVVFSAIILIGFYYWRANNDSYCYRVFMVTVGQGGGEKVTTR